MQAESTISPACLEHFAQLPITSEHVWRYDFLGLPTANCLKCGKPAAEYLNAVEVRVGELIVIELEKRGLPCKH